MTLVTVAWIFVAILIAWLLVKIGVKTLKFVVILIIASVVFWFLSGGTMKVEKPSNLPDLPIKWQ